MTSPVPYSFGSMSESISQPTLDLGGLSAGLRGTCAEYLSSYHAELTEQTRQGASGLAVASQHARVLDGLLGALYCASDALARVRRLSPRGRLALVAVGGYGRGTVGLHSDIDVLFLCDDPADPHVAAMADGILYPLWDLGLSIGHAVRGLDETLSLARDDIRTATTLLDARRVSGDASLVEDLLRLGRRQVVEPALSVFLDALEKGMIERHERFGGSLFLLEPEVKLGRGGLRDLDVAMWAAKARWGASELDEWVRNGALLTREVQSIEEALEMLWRVRNLLHARAGRRQDRLTFEDQEEIARDLGFVDGVTLGVEQFMQSYYRHARVVSQLAERMIARSRPASRRTPAAIEELGSGVLAFDGHVTLKNSDDLATDPSLALRFYREVVRRQLPPYTYARDAISRLAADPSWQAKLRESEDAPNLFARLLTHVGEAPVRRGSILNELHEVGLLLAMIPEFGPVTGRVQHDVYHVYTVDVHSVAAVDRLRALARGEFAADFPMASQIAAEAPRRLPLYLGLLLHDIGKAFGKDHAKRGAVIAEPIAERLRLSHVDVEHVVWLVREHLNLYHWAMRRDTSDPETVSEVARQVGTVERLRDLYLLTVSDLSTTSPTAMTSWKARMLDDLYLTVAEALEGDAPSRMKSRAEEIRSEVRVGFVGDAAQEELETFLGAMPDRYLLANPVDVIRVHARAARDRAGEAVHLVLRPGPSEDVGELVVITDDRPGLLADIAAVLSANRLTVGAAQIYTRKRRDGADEAFDVFHFRRPSRTTDLLSEAALKKLRRDMEDVLTGKATAEDLLARQAKRPSWTYRKVPRVRTEVHVDNTVSPRFTVVDVYTQDRSGLLYAIARALHEQGLSIALSKVNTEGVSVADVFYVEQRGGGKVADQAKLAQLSVVLREALGRLANQEAQQEEPSTQKARGW